MNLSEYVTIADIARLFSAHVKTVRDVYAHRPGFPRPAIAPSKRKRKWRLADVLKWAEPK